MKDSIKAKRTSGNKNGPSDHKPIRVFLVDDHELIRQGVRSAIENVPDMIVCGEAGDAGETMKSVKKARPDVAVVDLSLPVGSGVDLIRDIRVLCPAAQVIVLTMYNERLYAERALRIGALGYVMKQEPPARLIEGIRAVHRGELFVSDELASAMLKLFVNGDASAKHSGVDSLSNRELEVFENIGRGASTLQIAERHSLSPKTVETYRSNIKGKLALKNATELFHSAFHWVAAQDKGTPY